MLNFKLKLVEHFFRAFPVMMLLFNVISLILGILYFMIGDSNVFWNLYGFLMLVTFLGNIWLTAREEKCRRLSYLYLFLSFAFMLAVLFINTIVSLNPINSDSQSTVSAILLFSLYFLGGLISAKHYLDDKNKIRPKDANFFPVINRIKIIVKNSAIIVLSAVLYSGLFLSINLLRKYKNGILEVFISAYALFLAISFLSLGVLIIKLLNKKKYFLYYSIVLTATSFMFIACMLPFISIPTLLKNARLNYEAAFGTEVQSMSADSPKDFRKLPFFLPEYFLGIPSIGYQAQENVLFYQGTKGVDKGLELYFDVYMPTTDTGNLPGNHSVLIRIHGGGWGLGDKGMVNGAEINKYFAAQGYVVFDIQYGLNENVDWFNLIPVEKSRLGNFTIDDMVRHIGIFTKYLAEHGNEYGANLDSVFISGGSAGGQLALASGLGLDSGKYQKILSPKLQIKGLIPCYPANGLSVIFGIVGREEFLEPSYLVTKDSPPCLIYQGSHDGLVDPEIAEKFRDSYLERGNKKCAIIMMPFGGHASDLYFAGYYNQVFLYYMERFMYQYQ